jgi:ABC-type uncharacterized transport system permease subunit
MKLLGQFAAGFGRSLRATLTFRVNLLFDISLSVIGLVASIATVFIVYARTDSLAGWTEAETYVLIGTFQVLSSLKSTFIDPNLAWFPDNAVRRGMLDTFLLQPARRSSSPAWRARLPCRWSSSCSASASSRSGSSITISFPAPRRCWPGPSPWPARWLSPGR